MTALRPIKQTERYLTGWDFFILWAGAAICLTEIWAGGLLMPLGLKAGLAVVILGHIIGIVPLVLGGIIGSRTGAPAMITTRGALGPRGSYLPAVFNIVQLIGWTGVMLWFGGHAAARILPDSSFMGVRAWILVMGVLTTCWSLVGHGFWKWLQRVAVILLLILSAVMTYAVFTQYGFTSLLKTRPNGSLTFMLGLDLVIAMPISWLPLVSDYSRYARKTSTSAAGTWWGYLTASSWMYVVGLCAAVATQSDTPDTMVLDLLASLGLVAPALIIVLLSTFTTTFLDIYSNAVTTQSIFPKVNVRTMTFAGGAAGTVIALLFTATQYEGFLLFIGSMFCPLFGVILTDFFVLKKGSYVAEELLGRGRYWYSGGVNLRAMIALALGFGLYHLAARTGWPCGASIPGMLGTAVLYFALMSFGSKAKAQDA
ncbi:MAG: putative hydroxymethylpyrimidine transporter CytX [Verrucomicrobia bacterium]|nr:putative hydroxymethylpyrimidine transporter CytX [Verrucomicrobiota bacterium]